PVAAEAASETPAEEHRDEVAHAGAVSLERLEEPALRPGTGDQGGADQVKDGEPGGEAGLQCGPEGPREHLLLLARAQGFGGRRRLDGRNRRGSLDKTDAHQGHPIRLKPGAESRPRMVNAGLMTRME